MAIPSGFPTASTTGVPAGTTLTAYTGPMTITQNNVVIEGKIINGSLRVTGDNVVFKNCKITYDDWWGIDGEGAANLTVQNCDIVGPGYGGDSNAGILGSGNFIGNDISKSENGIVLGDGASTVKGNYIHDLQDGTGDPHYDGISVQGGQNGVLIEGNTVIGRDTSDIFIKNDFGPINNVIVNHNYLSSGPVYNIYVDGRASGGPITNIKITNNYLEKGYYGYVLVEDSSPVISGNVQYLPGTTPFSQTFWGTQAADNLPGIGQSNTGDDTFWGGGGSDTLRGGTGADKLEGGAGADRIDGGLGVDVSTYAASSHAVAVDLGRGKGAGGDAAGDVLTSVENLAGSRGADQLTGNTGTNTLRGDAGSDALKGMGGNDTLIADAGNDLLYGGDGSDRLYGGAGVDRLIGGAGNDFFVFNAPLNIANRDVVYDFSALQDTMWLENAAMTKLGAGTLKAAFFRAGPAALDANDFIIYNKANGTLFYDMNGNAAGGATLLATLTTKPALTFLDFVVI